MQKKPSILYTIATVITTIAFLIIILNFLSVGNETLSLVAYTSISLAAPVLAKESFSKNTKSGNLEGYSWVYFTISYLLMTLTLLNAAQLHVVGVPGVLFTTIGLTFYIASRFSKD